MTDTSALFQPFSIKSLTLKNRIVMAPMTRSFTDGGIPGPDIAEYYRKRAAGEVGLILSEGTVIDRPASRNEPGIPFFHSVALDGWKQVIDTVHQAGGKMGPQAWHCGALKSGATSWEPEAVPESPSGLIKPERPRGGAMSEADIAQSISAWAQAAADAQRLGFDMIEIHGAHGYLIDSFFWEGSNQRAGPYGGKTLKERARYARELVAEMRRAVGPDFPIFLRVSQWKQQDYSARLAHTPDEMADWLCPLVEAGVDVLDCSQRRYWEAEFPEIDGEDGLNFAGWAKKLTGAATMTVGSVGLSADFFGAFSNQVAEPAKMDKLILQMERGDFDLVGVGRALISNPDWAARVKAGQESELRPYTSEDLATLI